MPAPYQPFNVVLQTGNGQNFLLWPLVIGATSYSVQRSTDGINYSALSSPTTNNYLDPAVTVGTTYYYQVASINVDGTSAYSSSFPTNITPCLPGQINLGYLRYMAQLRADKLNSEYLTVDEWNWNINQSIGELGDILVSKYGDDYFQAPALYITTTGADQYAIPDGSNYPVNGVNAPALFKLNGMDVNIGGGTVGPNAMWTPVTRYNWSDRDKYTMWNGVAPGLLNGLYQLAYRPMGQFFQVIPPISGLTLRVWYVPIFTQLLQDTDMLPFSFSAWSEYVVVDAAMKAMVKEESLEKWNALSASKQALKDRIASISANRDTGMPNSVSNTRVSMGDPGFSGWGNNGFGSGGFSGGGF